MVIAFDSLRASNPKVEYVARPPARPPTHSTVVRGVVRGVVRRNGGVVRGLCGAAGWTPYTLSCASGAIVFIMIFVGFAEQL